MPKVRIAALVVAGLGCQDAEGASQGDPLGPDGHWFSPIELGASDEVSGVCQSWTLDNDEDIYVNGVHAINDGGWHHSNWVFVPEAMFGEDGTWNCADRNFSEATAANPGSGVFFAQSTQAPEETLQFGPGFAFRVPARSKVVGGVHLLNVLGADLETRIGMEIIEIVASEAQVLLNPMSFTYIDLEIPARSESHFVMECDIAQPYMNQLGRMPDFSFYYVVPHYHGLGTLMRLELVGGEHDGQVVFETDGRVGDPLGEPMDPPVPVAGARAIRLTCGYDNPRPDAVGYGIGDQEMCVFLAYTDSPLKFGTAGLANTYAGLEGGVHHNESPCTVLAVNGDE